MGYLAIAHRQADGVFNEGPKWSFAFECGQLRKLATVYITSRHQEGSRKVIIANMSKILAFILFRNFMLTAEFIDDGLQIYF